MALYTSEGEVQAAGYKRMPVELEEGANGRHVIFPVADASWGTIEAMALIYPNGRVVKVPITRNVAVEKGDTLSFQEGDIVVEEPSDRYRTS